MKKYFLIVTFLFLTPSIALASWWNPLTWFDRHNTVEYQQNLKTEININKNEVTTTRQQSSSTEPLSTTDNESTLRKQIESVNNQNITLAAKLALTENELASIQKNYNVCQGKLTNTQKSSVSTQHEVKQTEPIFTNPVSTLESAVILLDDGSPLTSTVTTTKGQYPNLPVLKFDIHSSQRDQLIDSVTININSSGSGMTNTASLYNTDYPTTPIATAFVKDGIAVFSNISTPYQLLKDSPYPYNVFIVKLNVSGLGVVGSSQSISTSVSKVKILNLKGQNINTTGTAQGNVITVNTI